MVVTGADAVFDAWHLPGLAAPPITLRSYGDGEGAVRLRIPQLTPELLEAQVDALLGARDQHLTDRPVGEIVGAVDAVAGRLLDPDDPLRQAAERALPAVTGSSLPMVRAVLDRMAADWRAGRLWELLRAEFGDPAVLDHFRPRANAAGRTRAFGPRLSTHVFSGNTLGVAVTSLVRSLLLKSATLGKTASGEPLLAALFARGLAEVDPELGRCVAVTYWPGGDEMLERVALQAADVVIVYGGHEAIASFRARTPPRARFIGYGHKLSFGVIAREALAADAAGALAERAAREVALFDQHGCVSPHLFYVEEGGEVDPADWAALLADAMERLEAELPRGALQPGEAAAIRQLRGEMEFAGIAGQGMRLFASPRGTAWTVIYDPDPSFAASCLNRVVRVKPVTGLHQVADHVREIAPVLQTVGLAGPEERLAELATELGRLGASRVTELGSMAWPPPAWHHDGHPPLRDMVRWCDWD